MKISLSLPCPAAWLRTSGHIRGERPYVFETCGKALSGSSDVTVHMRTHLGTDRENVCAENRFPGPAAWLRIRGQIRASGRKLGNKSCTVTCVTSSDFFFHYQELSLGVEFSLTMTETLSLSL